MREIYSCNIFIITPYIHRGFERYSPQKSGSDNESADIFLDSLKNLKSIANIGRFTGKSIIFTGFRSMGAGADADGFLGIADKNV